MDAASPKYRPDIDGLRAVAVLAVVLYHAFPNSFPGGFIGVDIFFVLSGYLITSILLASLGKGRFSLLEFYDRRIRRIFPALVTVLLACLAYGWFRFFDDELERLGRHVAAGAGFVANLLLLWESGPFDLSPNFKPLIHLWSLAIEEQFYLLWPLLLAFAWKRRLNLLAVAGALGLASFAFNVHLASHDPAGAFYSPFARFWQLLAGGALAHAALHRPQPGTGRHAGAVSLAGAALLAAGFALIDKSTWYPGWWALFPTAGTAMLIHAGAGAWVNRQLLSRRVLVGIGLISYPLYLWHWPLLALPWITEGSPGAAKRLLLMAAAVALAWATWRFVEQPLRFARPRRTAPALLAALAATGVAGLSCVLTGGWPGSGPREPGRLAFLHYFDNAAPQWRYAQAQRLGALHREQCDFLNREAERQGRPTRVPVAAIAPECHERDPARGPALMLWGDEHAAQLHAGLRRHLPAPWQLLQVTARDCLPSLEASAAAADAPGDYCRRSNWFALRTIRATRPEVLVVAQEAGHAAAAMGTLEARLRALGVRHVVFTGPAPRWRQELPALVARHLWHPAPRRTLVGLNLRVLAADRVLQRQLKLSPQGRFVSLVDYFCDRAGCLTWVGTERQAGLVSWDGVHLTPAASEALARDRLAPLVRSLVDEGPPGGAPP